MDTHPTAAQHASTDLPVYGSRQAPGYLYTVTQLSDIGLLPGGPVRAFVNTTHDPARLYDVTEAQHLQKPSYKQ